MTNNPTLVFGHRNPDTDSVCSAISFSYLKNKLGENTSPRVLGHINKETAFALNYFNVKEPEYLNNVKVQLRNVFYHKGIMLSENASIKEVVEYLTDNHITATPIVDDKKHLVSLITLKEIAMLFVEKSREHLNTNYEHVKEALNGREILKFHDEFDGTLIAGSYKSQTFIETAPLKKNDILIVGNRNKVIKHGLESGIALLVLTNNFDLDVIILGRGGGSIEDLWAFNEEIVAEAIFNSKIPIISAVGHEIDFTISDFVADLRAPTPTAAAELAVPSTIELISYINQLNIRRNKGIVNIINKNKEKLLSLTSSYILKNPESIYEIKAQKIDNLIEKLLFIMKNNLDNNYNKLKHIDVFLNNNIKNVLSNKTNKYINILNKLETLNPILTIKRGYTITSVNDKSFNSINSVKKDDIIKTEVMDGYIRSKVIEIGEK